LAATLVSEFQPAVRQPHPIESITLIPSGGGVFDVEADGELIFSKHQVHRHAEASEVVNALRGRLQSK